MITSLYSLSLMVIKTDYSFWFLESWFWKHLLELLIILGIMWQDWNGCDSDVLLMHNDWNMAVYYEPSQGISQ